MSPIQSILVHVDAGPNCAPRLQGARALGAHTGARVTAMYAVTPLAIEMALDVGMGTAQNALFELDDARRSTARELVARVSAEPGVQIDWREVREAAEYWALRQALYADLLVLGQHDRAHRDTGVRADFVPSILIASGKPALVVPYIGTRASTFQTVMVAWKETREAARALTAAIPILRTARAVHVVLERDTMDAHKELLQAFLQRHGIEARYQTLTDSAAVAGEAMLSMAADLDADLLVMGCYGHSRARELVLGGASRTVLESMTLPVLMAH